MNTLIKLVLCAVMVSFASTATAANLIHDGGFESPVVPAGSYTIFGVGQKIDRWTVVGNDPGTQPFGVSLMSGTYTQDGITFNARSGSQYLNLRNVAGGAGALSTAGVEQTVALVPGSKYVLSFWLGSGFDPGTEGETGAMSRVDVFLDGVLTMSAIQPGKANSSSQSWKQFSLAFTATTNMTSITFMNPTWQTTNVGLDDIELVLAPPT